MKKRYRYKRTVYKIGDTIFKRVGENQLISIKDKDGFQISFTFIADLETHNRVIDEIDNILLGILIEQMERKRE